MREENEQSDDEDTTIKVCQGLTEEERREIRKSQRLLRKEIPDLDVEEARDRNNEIFKNVRYIRESVLDAENLEEIAQKASNRVDQLVQAPRYDADRVVSKLVEQCRVTKGGNSYFDWSGLGIQAGVCFNAVPSQVSFLNGPLVDGNEEIQVKQRAKRVRNTQTESDAEEERPEDVKGHTARGEDQLSAIQKNMADVKHALEVKVDRNYNSKKRQLGRKYGGVDSIPERMKKKLKKHNDVCAIELLFNPKSFTQTVENMYHYSFLVKEGNGSLQVRDNKILDKDKGIQLEGGPVVKYIKSVNGDKVVSQPRQAVINLTMEDWKDLVEAYDVKSSDVPHRGS